MAIVCKQAIGENLFTLAHIRASLSDTYDLSSSNKYTGPLKNKAENSRQSPIYLIKAECYNQRD